MSPDKYKRKCGKIVGSEYGTKEVDFMNQNSFNRFHDSAENIRNKFLNALPVILYFLLMFYSVMKKEKKMKNINGVKYQRYIKDEPELSRLMNEYAHNLSELYALVLKTCRG